jgi:hypothetical protein
VSTDIDRFIIQLSTLIALEKALVTKWRKGRIASVSTMIATTRPNYSIWPMSETEYDRDIVSNTIPTSQLRALIGRKSNSQCRNLTRKSAMGKTQGEIKR